MTQPETTARPTPTAAPPPALPPPADRVPLHVWTMLGALAANMFSGYSQYLGFPVGPDRLLLAATLGLLVLDVQRPRLVWRPVYAVMLALLVWTAWSAIGAGTLVEKNGMFALLDRICVPFLMFVLGPLVLTDERRRLLLLQLMTLIGIYLGATCVLEIVGPHALVWPRYVMDPSIGILFGRARGPFLNSEANGMVMGISLFMAMTLWARSRGRWRVLAAAAVCADVVGLALCLTRSVWLATVLATLVVGWLVPTVRRRLPVLAVGAAAAVAAMLAAVPSAAELFTERFTMVSSVYDRQNTNAAALRIIAEHPVTGIGWHRFIDAGSAWVRQADDYPVTNVMIEVHNVFLSRAAETGIPGAVLWGLAVLLGPGQAVLRLPRGGPERTWTLLLVAALCYWAVPSMTSPNSYPLPNNLMWLVGGFASARYLVVPAPARPSRRTPPAEPT